MKDRKLNRLGSYDYNSEGYYFVTICTEDKGIFFGKIKNNEMILSKIGKIANEIWYTIPEFHKNIKLDEFIIMPDHIHGIIVVVGNAGMRSSSNSTQWNAINSNSIKWNANDQDRSKMELSKTIHAFKSAITREIRKKLNNNYFTWQKSFHDRIIRNEEELNNVRQYIIDNPINWVDELL